MDIRAKVEARKAELAAGDLAAKSAEEEAERARTEAERIRRHAALDEIAQDISRDGIEVQRSGEEIELVLALEPLDVDGLRRDKLRNLLNREGRKLWSRGDNWLVISLIVAGLFLLPMGGAGVVLIIAGGWRGEVLNKRYRAVVAAKYPGLFAPSPEANPAI